MVAHSGKEARFTVTQLEPNVHGESAIHCSLICSESKSFAGAQCKEMRIDLASNFFNRRVAAALGHGLHAVGSSEAQLAFDSVTVTTGTSSARTASRPWQFRTSTLSSSRYDRHFA